MTNKHGSIIGTNTHNKTSVYPESGEEVLSFKLVNKYSFQKT